MNYVLTYPIFDPTTAERIARFRSAHEPERARLVPPHITLVFGLDSQHAPTLAKRCSRLAEQNSAFSVTLTRSEIIFDPFEKAHKLFLICSGGADRLTGLHDCLYKGALQTFLDPDHPFRPHMTVATQQTRQGVENIDHQDLGPLPITARIAALNLVKRVDNTLLPIATFPLQQETSLP